MGAGVTSPPTSRAVRRIGVVGCGAVAQQTYALTLPRVAGLEVAYVSDLDPDAAEALGKKLGARVASLEELCGDVEAVLVATPPGTHYALVRRCLEAGVSVVCEKPFLGKAAEAEELAGLAEARGVGLRVAHFRRTFPGLRHARELLASGVLGAVRRVDVAEGGRFAWEARSGYVTKDVLGGVMFDTGSHSLDMMLFGGSWDLEPLTVDVGWVRRDRPEPSHELEAEFVLHTEGGEIAVHVHLSRYEALANRIRYEATNGVLEMPVGLRDRLRLSGPRGSVVLAVRDVPAALTDCFLSQWERVFGDDPAAVDEFRARRFVGLTAILEALAQEQS